VSAALQCSARADAWLKGRLALAAPRSAARCSRDRPDPLKYLRFSRCQVAAIRHMQGFGVLGAAGFDREGSFHPMRLFRIDPGRGSLRPRWRNIGAPLSGVERTSGGQPLNEYTAKPLIKNF
jgi:hypothetical protein